MTTSIDLPDSIGTRLSAYCQAEGISESEAVKRALDMLFGTPPQSTAYELGQQGFGSDQTHAGDIARNSKRLLREKFRHMARWLEAR
ncbi:hypothetical protein [Methylomagnum ishizawai]|uniref:hypothetical protein n=1 Tax=Methylomagnum ishizawai TaxID=1760988 RepID=UPI001C31FE1F|nr:hypothetical protein [Methylomagnum ishizawai]BBL76430.1 hypothetical protein MishRS11D_35280 [Methylomagnum ishizawai]